MISLGCGEIASSRKRTGTPAVRSAPVRARSRQHTCWLPRPTGEKLPSGASASHDIVRSYRFREVLIYFVDGVAVHHYQPAAPNDKPPIVMVHGGMHAAWAWDQYGQFLAEKGWDCHALDWYNHGQSTALPEADFIKRGHTDLHREILAVSRQFPAFHLMGHSMGALATLISSTLLNPESLTLFAPVVPAAVGADPVPMEVDLTQLFPVPPFEVAKGMFFSTMTDAEAQPYYTKLQPESSQTVWESARRNVPVNLAAVRAPTLAVAAGADTLTPPTDIEKLANMMDATYLEYPGIGHCELLMKASAWQQVAADVETWLSKL
jgi:pimeloyl-ACP methyl ester carboxylesterase